MEESRSQRIAIGAALLAWLTVGYGAWSGIFGEGAGLGFALSWGLYGAFMLAVIFGSRWLTGIPRHIALSALVVLGVVTVWTMPASGFNIAMLVLTVAAAEAAVGLAILVVYFRNRGEIAVEDVNVMRG